MDRMSEQEQEYERMRGEYLSLIASIEFNMTFLLAEYLEVQRHSEEFHQWFRHAPIPFGSKVNLFEIFIGESTMVSTNYGNACADLRESYEFRNTLAHSFRTYGGMTTARGREIPEEQVAFPVLKEKLERVRRLESMVGAMLYDHLVGEIPPFSADDFADWPP